MENTPASSEEMTNLFKAPAALAIKTLDRSLFSKILPASAAVVRDNRLLSKYRSDLSKTQEILFLDRLTPIVTSPDPVLAQQGRKCVILNPKVKVQDSNTWSAVLKEAQSTGDLEIIPYDVEINYELWSYLDVIKSILPEDLHVEIPSGFNTAGHVAHLNLREAYLPYKHIIAQVILDKNPHIRTVINKIDDVGSENEFRTFNYEVLAGPDDMFVELSEANCVFAFDYSKVYWNSKLGNEHQRLVDLFKPGEVVVDLMAGIGPFAVPAGKKGVFVWANDKNPESHMYLDLAIEKNKVSDYVKPFNRDGHEFICQSADDVLASSQRGEHVVVRPAKPSKKVAKSRTNPPPPAQAEKVYVPPTISHFVMNLPASAIEFLHNFRGLYQGKEELFQPHTETLLPMIHCHCFAAKLDNEEPINDVLGRIEAEIGVLLKSGDGEKEGEATITEVRDVAPKKRMFCASFRLPKQVAFAARVNS